MFIYIWLLITFPELVESSAASHQKPKRFSADLTDSQGRYDVKRGVNIGLQLKMPTTEKIKNLESLEKDILKKLTQEFKGRKGVKLPLITEPPTKRLLLKPAFECDRWDPKTRTCWLDRNTGDTVTLSLSTGFKSRHTRPDVVWKKEFAQRNSGTRKEHIINPENPPRNLVIGRRGYELRVSPIMELDLDDNQFSATFSSNSSMPYVKVNFRIRVVAEDLGFVYIGETLDLSIGSFISLPLESMSYHWYTEKEGEFATLPSNMRISSTGETLRISELRQEQEGIVACSIYTNKDIHASKKRFLIKELAKNKDVLKTFSDHHDLSFQEEDENLHRHKKFSELRNKRIPHRKQEKKSTHPITEKSPKTIREAKPYQIVEGKHYNIIRPLQDGTNKANPNLDMEKHYPVDDGLVPDTNEKTPEGMSLLLGNSSDMGTVLNFKQEHNTNAEEDKVALLVSYCVRDIQCSKHATCIRMNLRDNGFCRCLPGFYGPGIFCREEA